MYHLILVLSEANLSDGLLLAPYRVLVNDEDQQSSHHPMHNAKIPHHLVQHGVPFDHDCIERPVRVPAGEAAVVGTGEAVRHGPAGRRLDGVSFAVEGIPVPAPTQRIRAAEVHVGMVA